jgi:hypothetical protein
MNKLLLRRLNSLKKSRDTFRLRNTRLQRKKLWPPM